MSDEKDTAGKPPPEEDRTVYMPGGAGGSALGPGGATPPADEDRTVYRPSGEAGDAAMGGDTARQSPPSPDQATVAPTNFGAPFQPRADSRAIQIGDVLNHIFEVKRFIARGGMGEVFEGVNVNTDERVAIKVMLPALAADANVIALFRKEARTLTRLQHEALVQYRVLAQEPQLGVLYIVTEYIDGVNLADALGKIQPTPDELRQLLAKLASGLRVAHALGAVHRDMSPDNVLLDGGRLDGAKVIDFGIAKDLDPSSKTIVGEGFAGKLNYVAPEQLGDFGREIGPWTDVYSLALVILAVAMGKNVQMGGSLVDAVDKRRAGPDLSGAPELLRPVLEKMLKANPKERLRSMDEVLKEVGHTPGGGSVQYVEVDKTAVSKPVLIGGSIAALALIAGLGWLAFGQDPVDRVALARTTINQVLPTVECSWLDVVNVESGEDRTLIRMAGVAGSPGNAQSKISQALTAAGLPRAAINFEDVAIIRPAGCSALESYSKIRRTSDLHLSVTAREFEIQADGEGAPPVSLANVVIRKPDGQNFSLLGIEPNGAVTQVIPGQDEFDQLVAEGVLAPTGNGQFRIPLNMDHTGWSGVILLTGDAPFPAELVAPPVEARSDNWQSDFVAMASERDWKSEMLWVKSVDKVPN